MNCEFCKEKCGKNKISVTTGRNFFLFRKEVHFCSWYCLLEYVVT